MKTSLPADLLRQTAERLQTANLDFAARYPGESGRRQPVHTVYGGAHLFKSDTAQRLGALGLRSLEQYAPDFVAFAKAVGLAGAEELPDALDENATFRALLESNPEAVRRDHRPAWLAHTVHARVAEKLRREPVEDFRIDFEDGYGNRPDAEEDAHAEQAARETAAGMKAATLPPFLGIRIKPFNEELRQRSTRTLDIFLSTLVEAAGGTLPDNFYVTLPKVTIPEQVAALADIFDALEPALGLASGTLKMELMIETTQSIIDRRGRSNLPLLHEAARGRCTGAHFGTYDYTASCQITAAHQHMLHPSCDFAKHMMQVAFGGTGVWLSDGATNIMPVPVHRAAEGAELIAGTTRREPRLRPPRLAPPLRTRPPLAHRRLLSRLGPPPRPTPHALRRRLLLLPRKPRSRLRTPPQLHRQSRQSHARRRCLRRRRHRPGSPQLLPPRPQLRRPHRTGSA